VREQSFAEWWATEGSLRPTALAAWTDAHWQLLLGQSPLVRQPQTAWYAQALTEALAAVLWQAPGYWLHVAVQDGCLAQQVRDYCQDATLQALRWCSLRLDRALTSTRLPGVPLVVLGPPYVRHWRSLLNYEAFVPVPPRHAFWCAEDLVAWTSAAVEAQNRRAMVWVIAEWIGPWLVDQLWRRFSGRAWVIDAQPWLEQKQLIYSVEDP
jgi:hypothetical protein